MTKLDIYCDLYQKNVTPLYYQIGECKSKIDILMRDRESRVELIKSFENRLNYGIAFDAKMAAKYPEVHKHSAYVDIVTDLSAVIDEQHKKIVEADREIERLYFKLSDTVKIAKQLEKDYYRLTRDEDYYKLSA